MSRKKPRNRQKTNFNYQESCKRTSAELVVDGSQPQSEGHCTHHSEPAGPHWGIQGAEEPAQAGLSTHENKSPAGTGVTQTPHTLKCRHRCTAIPDSPWDSFHCIQVQTTFSII